MKSATTSDPMYGMDEGLEYPASPFRSLVLVGLALLGGLGVTRVLSGDADQALNGVLQAESSAVTSRCDARVIGIHVEPGEVVAEGTALVALADDGLAERLSSGEQELIVARAELEQAQAVADIQLAWRTKELQDESFRTRLKSAEFLREKITSQVERVAWEEFLTDRTALTSRSTPDEIFGTVILEDDLLSSEARVRAILRQNAAESAAQVNEAQLKLCDDRLEELSRMQAELPERVRRSAGVDVAEARVKRLEQEVQGLRARQAALTLTAPAYGTVGVLQKQIGDHVEAGEVMVSLLDEDRRYIDLQVPGGMLPQIVPDREVTIEFPGGIKREGRIGTLPPQTPSTTAGDQDGVASVRVTPAGKTWPELPIGTQVRVIMTK